MRIRIIMLFIITSLFSCSKNNEVTEINSSELTLRPTLGEVSTRTLIDNSNITLNDIRIQISKADGSEYSIGNSKLILSYSTSWSLSSPFYLSANPATVYAYSPTPVSPATVEVGEFSSLMRLLTLSSTTEHMNQVDYLWAKQDKTTSLGAFDINYLNSNVSLKMNHALSLISFVIYKDGYANNGLLEQFSIIDNSASPSLIVSKSTNNDLCMSISNGAITGGTKVNSVTVNSISKIITEDIDPGLDPSVLKSKICCYALIAPVTIADKTKISFSFLIDGNIYSVNLTGSGPVSWLAGQHYIYKVKLCGTEILFDGVSVTSWSEAGNDILI